MTEPERGGGPGIGDVRFAVRSLVRRPVFTLAAIVTLAIGIGATVVVFSAVYGLLYRPLPYPAADRLVMVWSGNELRGWTRGDVTIPDALDWRDRSGVFENLTVLDRRSATLLMDGAAERLTGHAATHAVFDVLGARPLHGRAFLPEEAEPGAAAVVMLFHGLWQRRFGGDPRVVGRSIVLNNVPHTVVGVLRPEFVFPDMQSDFLLPLAEDRTASRSDHSHLALGRLRSGVSIEHANEQIAGVAAALAEEYPDTNENWSAHAVSVRNDALQPEGRAAAQVLGGAVLFVLLMACANVTNLLLARGRARRREMAVRRALGAGRGRLVRQLLTETALIAIVGGLIGVLASFSGVSAIVSLLPQQISPVIHIAVDAPVLAFSVLLTLGVTFGVGLVPALRNSRADGLELREEGGSGGGRGGRRFGNTLIVTQMALAVVLLVGGGTLARSVVGLQRQDLGYDPTDLLTFRISAPESNEDAERLHASIAQRVASLPGVVSVGAIHSLPLRGANNVGSFRIPGDPNEDGWAARLNWITPGYFPTMRQAVLRGRGIEPSDRDGTNPVVVVNALLARQRFGDEEVIGSTIRLAGTDRTIVGVITDSYDRAVTRAPEPSLYLSAAQFDLRTRSYVVRTSVEPPTLAASVRRAIAEIDAGLPAFELGTFEELVADRISPFKLIAGLMFGFAVVALVLAAVGLYGVTAYGVGRRTNEIGLRLAIGAERGGVVSMIIREAMRRAALGIGIGLMLAIPLSSALRAVAVGVNPLDPLTFGVVAVTLAGVSLLGAWLPARRAVRLDPMRALAGD